MFLQRTPCLSDRGDGVREGGEQCDGQDWAVAACTDLGPFTGGTLSCNAAGTVDACQLDLSMCVGAGVDSTAGDGIADGSGGDASADETGAGTGSGAVDGGGGGCDCRSASPSAAASNVHVVMGLLMLTLLAYRRRRQTQ